MAGIPSSPPISPALSRTPFAAERHAAIEQGFATKPKSVSIRPISDPHELPADIYDSILETGRFVRNEVKLATTKEFNASAFTRFLDKLCCRVRDTSQRERATINLKRLLTASKKELSRNPPGGNLLMARALLKVGREDIYLRGNKSDNKWRAPPPGTYPNAWHRQETGRVRAAGVSIKPIRLYLLHPPYYNGAISKALQADGHNCTDIALAKIGLLKSIKAAKIIKTNDFGLLSWDKFDHAVVVIGDLPDNLPENIEEWPPDIAISDSWGNIACPARDFPRRMLEKLDKWQRDGKKIYDSTSRKYEDPTYPDAENDLKSPSRYLKMSD